MLKSWFTAKRLKWLGLIMMVFGLTGSVWLVSNLHNVRAADCDDNAVIRCGVSSEAAAEMKCVENLGNTQGIFQAFGINCSDLKGLQAGQVSSDNKVYVRNTSGGYDLVATGAVTAGRQRMASSDTPIAGGAAYQRPPSESFVSSPLSALVKMDGSGKFLYAVIMSCGNPVIATPVTQPSPPPPQQPPQPPPSTSYTIEKTDRKDANDPWSESVSVKPNDFIQFRLLVKNTGQTALDGTKVTDLLPSGVSFVPDSLYIDGKPYKVDITTAGVTLISFAPGQTITITFEGKAQDVDACNGKELTNTGSMQPPNQPKESDTAKVQICKPNEKVVTVTKTKIVSAPKTELPNTGPGSVIAIFLLTTVGGAAAYQFQMRRKMF